MSLKSDYLGLNSGLIISWVIWGMSLNLFKSHFFFFCKMGWQQRLPTVVWREADELILAESSAQCLARPAHMLWRLLLRVKLILRGVNSNFKASSSELPYGGIWEAAGNVAEDSVSNPRVCRVAPCSLPTCHKRLWVSQGLSRLTACAFEPEYLWGPLSGSEHLWGRTDFCFKSIVYQHSKTKMR